MRLSIIIVNYNVTTFLRSCLLSIGRYVNAIEYEVIVIDNNSSDISWRDLIVEFPEVTFIANSKNEGFAAANNKAARTAKGEYLLLLNPDTELESDFMSRLILFMDGLKSPGCVGVRMHDAQGNFLPESKRSVPNMFNSFEKLFINFRTNNTKSYYRKDIGEYQIAKTDVITGAFFLCKKVVYEEVGGLDEAYFMYGEDIDICYTMLRMGYENYYYGEASILHHKGESSVKDERYLEMFYGAMQIFIDKYYKKNVIKHALLSVGLKAKHQLEILKIKKTQ
ncbi:glycosyltransferase family 2 protein [Bacteroides sp. 214]|uniref:glycosyltransferase family 2 protein n=1 Tax=Bacteroides sp. 214 TaxID=2302935 RepID=UPI0013D8CC91|nr:glycosyltransferase family 2 protein [Bacteroides sp. 214]NDW11860.1 glycosyltransferase family 2 protein [Bacteroides sp. 214]